MKTLVYVLDQLTQNKDRFQEMKENTYTLLNVCR